MAGSQTLPGGDLERTVLLALCDRERASAREIHEAVGEPDGLAYTTTAKVLDRLHTKGLTARELMGKAFLYRATVKREEVERALARETVGKLLGAEPRAALAALVGAVESIDEKLLDDLARVVAARRRARRGS